MSFADAITTDLSVFFNTNHFAVSVIYTPLNREGSTIPIIIASGDESLQDPQPAGDELVILAKESDIATPNPKGDRFTIDSITYYLTKNEAGPKPDGIWQLRISRSERRQL